MNLSTIVNVTRRRFSLASFTVGLAGLLLCSLTASAQSSTEAASLIEISNSDPSAKWQVRASHNRPNGQSPASNAVDDVPTNRWTSGTRQKIGMWFELNLRSPQTVDRMVLTTSVDPTPHPGRARVAKSLDFPKSFEVFVSSKSLEDAEWAALTSVANGGNSMTGSEALGLTADEIGNRTIINFDAQQKNVQFIRIYLTKNEPDQFYWWSIMGIQLFTETGVDTDQDKDTIIDAVDNCPATSNSDQINTDGDLQGDACDTDDDNDGRDDAEDNCSLVVNSNQDNADQDEFGDACDADDDNDGRDDAEDNCPLVANTNQDNADQDELGDACDTDDDNDGRDDADDNCPLVANPEQDDADGDLQGDACDADDDNDGHDDGEDNCPAISNSSQDDLDGDEVGDLCDEDFIAEDENTSAPARELPALHVCAAQVKEISPLTGKEGWSASTTMVVDDDMRKFGMRVDKWRALPKNAIDTSETTDRDPKKTRWTSYKAQVKDMDFTIKFGGDGEYQPLTFNRIELKTSYNASKNPNNATTGHDYVKNMDHPRHFRVSLKDSDGTAIDSLELTDEMADDVTDICFDGVKSAHQITVTLLEEPEGIKYPSLGHYWWSIHDVNLYQVTADDLPAVIPQDLVCPAGYSAAQVHTKSEISNPSSYSELTIDCVSMSDAKDTKTVTASQVNEGAQLLPQSFTVNDAALTNPQGEVLASCEDPSKRVTGLALQYEVAQQAYSEVAAICEQHIEPLDCPSGRVGSVLVLEPTSDRRFAGASVACISTPQEGAPLETTATMRSEQYVDAFSVDHATYTPNGRHLTDENSKILVSCPAAETVTGVALRYDERLGLYVAEDPQCAKFTSISSEQSIPSVPRKMPDRGVRIRQCDAFTDMYVEYSGKSINRGDRIFIKSIGQDGHPNQARSRARDAIKGCMKGWVEGGKKPTEMGACNNEGVWNNNGVWEQGTSKIDRVDVLDKDLESTYGDATFVEYLRDGPLAALCSPAAANFVYDGPNQDTFTVKANTFVSNKGKSLSDGGRCAQSYSYSKTLTVAQLCGLRDSDSDGILDRDEFPGCETDKNADCAEQRGLVTELLNKIKYDDDGTLKGAEDEVTTHYSAIKHEPDVKAACVALIDKEASVAGKKPETFHPLCDKFPPLGGWPHAEGWDDEDHQIAKHFFDHFNFSHFHLDQVRQELHALTNEFGSKLDFKTLWKIAKHAIGSQGLATIFKLNPDLAALKAGFDLIGKVKDLRKAMHFADGLKEITQQIHDGNFDLGSLIDEEMEKIANEEPLSDRSRALQDSFSEVEGEAGPAFPCGRVCRLLSGPGREKYRLDYALEFAPTLLAKSFKARGFVSGAWINQVQIRFFFTHPRINAEGRLTTQIRIRALDLAGYGVSLGFLQDHLDVSLAGGPVSLHDLIFTYSWAPNESWKDRRYDGVDYLSAVGVLGEASATLGTKAKDFSAGHGTNPGADLPANPLTDLTGGLFNIPENVVPPELVNIAKEYSAKAKVTLELGGALAVAVFYNLDKMASLERENFGIRSNAALPLFEIIVTEALGAMGAVAMGFYSGLNEYVAAESPKLFSALFNVETMVGGIYGDLIYFLIHNGIHGRTDAIKLSAGGFAYVAVQGGPLGEISKFSSTELTDGFKASLAANDDIFSLPVRLRVMLNYDIFEKPFFSDSNTTFSRFSNNSNIQIGTRYSGKCIANIQGDQVRQNLCDVDSDTINTNWQARKIGGKNDDIYEFRAQDSGHCLALSNSVAAGIRAGGGIQPGEQVMVMDCKAALFDVNQNRWHVSIVGNNTITIRPVLDKNSCLDLTDSNPLVNTKIQFLPCAHRNQNQQFEVKTMIGITDEASSHTIHSLNGYCLLAAGDRDDTLFGGTKNFAPELTSEACSGNAGEEGHWNFKRYGENDFMILTAGKGGTFALTAGADERVINLATPQINGSQPATSQLWTLDFNSGGTVTIKAKQSNKTKCVSITRVPEIVAQSNCRPQSAGQNFLITNVIFDPRTTAKVVRYEAEAADISSSSVEVVYVGAASENQALIWQGAGEANWTVDVPNAGPYPIMFGYALLGQNRTLDLSVNGNFVETISFVSTTTISDPEIYRTYSEDRKGVPLMVDLKKGSNDIVMLRKESGSSPLFIDYLEVVQQ